MATKSSAATNKHTRFLQHWVKLPVTFFGESWAKDTYGKAYKDTFDLVQLKEFKKGGRGFEDCYLFEWTYGVMYHLPSKELMQFNKNGLVYGMDILFLLLVCCCLLTCVCVFRYKAR